MPASTWEVEAPCFEHQNGSRGRHLNNGEPYTDDEVYRYVFMGQAPYEASERYSIELKDAVRSCLLYRPEDRPGLDELRNLVLLYMNDDGLGTTARGSLWVFSQKEHCRMKVGVRYTGQKRKRAQTDG